MIKFVKKNMSTTQIKERISRYLDNADTRFLYLIYGMVKADVKSSLVRSQSDFDIDRKQYNKEIADAERRIKEGNFITQEILDKEMEQW